MTMTKTYNSAVRRRRPGGLKHVQNGRHIRADGASVYVMTRWVRHTMYTALVEGQPSDSRPELARRITKARRELRAICDRHRADIMTLERGDRWP